MLTPANTMHQGALNQCRTKIWHLCQEDQDADSSANNALQKSAISAEQRLASVSEDQEC
jgi:hypothetical protein